MPDAGSGLPYRVLARKYRPQTFEALVGQEAMVRTLANAIDSGRLAHAFILTGVRGVGKTTTARIIARALNCIGADGSGGPTVAPCGQCDNCQAITEDRHVDVLEMDAASRTGVDDIRELISGVRYLPVQARFKVYIIDEVHMLSRNAFNALLKTLEEPPEHVKFIFATTEIRKVPVTVLSRCQRFDLRRVDADKLIAHFRRIASEEDAGIDDEALALLARAAEGSVRDGLSLLDQAIAHGAGQVSAEAVRDMLGLADRAVVFDLFEALMAGDVKIALAILRGQYESGADPGVVLQDLLAVSHWLTTLKLAPEAGQDATTSQTERQRGRDMAEKLSMPTLTRVWQMLLKGLGELRQAPAPIAAAEMVLLRIAYTADLPDPADLVRRLAGAAEPAPATDRPPSAPAIDRPPSAGPTDPPPSAGPTDPPPLQAVVGDDPRPDPPIAAAATAPADRPNPLDFAAVVALFGSRRELQLQAHLVNDVHLVHFAPDRIALRPTADAPRSLIHDLQQMLSDWTGRRWVVSVSRETGQPTLGAARVAAKQSLRDEAEAHPLVQQARAVFPGAEIRAVRSAGSLDGAADTGTLDEESEE